MIDYLAEIGEPWTPPDFDCPIPVDKFPWRPPTNAEHGKEVYKAWADYLFERKLQLLSRLREHAKRKGIKPFVPNWAFKVY